MPQRFRPLVALPRRLLLVRIFAVLSGLLGIAIALLGTRSWSSLKSVLFFVMCLMLFRLSLCGLASNDEAVSIVKGWSTKVVRYATIESFEWLHNLESLGAPGNSDIWLTPDGAAALVADLETRRRAQRVGAE